MSASPVSRVRAAFIANPALVHLPISDCAAAIGMSAAALIKVYRHCPELSDLIDQLPDLTVRKCRYCHIDMELHNTYSGCVWLCPRCYTQRSSLPAPEKPQEGYKRCPRCEQVLPATTEYFGVSNRPKSGLTPCCRECERAKSHERYIRQSEEAREEQSARNRIRYHERKERKQS